MRRRCACHCDAPERLSGAEPRRGAAARGGRHRREGPDRGAHRSRRRLRALVQAPLRSSVPPSPLFHALHQNTLLLTADQLAQPPGRYGDFLFFWRESQVYAARHKRFKLHYITRSGFNISDLGTFHDPPLVFDVEQVGR